MNIDDLLFVIIIGGVALSIAYLRAQFMMQRSYRIAKRANELHLRTQPVSRTSSPKASANAVLNGSLPVHVRLRDHRRSGSGPLISHVR